MTAVAAFLRASLGRAAHLLNGSAVPKDDAVHEARKRLKAARAALRLLRPILGKTREEREALLLRRAARRLSLRRDARVIADLLASLRAPAGTRLPTPRRRPPDWRRSGAEIDACRRRLARAFPRELAASQARDGLARTYRQARRRLRAARRSGSGADRHALRKSVKRLRVQLDLLRPGCRTSSRLGRIARLLGDERDLTLLLSRLPRRDPWARAVSERARRRRSDLPRRALALARAALKRPARDFARNPR